MLKCFQKLRVQKRFYSLQTKLQQNELDLANQHYTSLLKSALESKDCNLAISCFQKLAFDNAKLIDFNLWSRLVYLLSAQSEAVIRINEQKINDICIWGDASNLNLYGKLGMALLHHKMSKLKQFETLALEIIAHLPVTENNELCRAIGSAICRACSDGKSPHVVLAIFELFQKQRLLDKDTLLDILIACAPPLVPHSAAVLDKKKYNSDVILELVTNIERHSESIVPILGKSPSLSALYIDILGYLHRLSAVEELVRQIAAGGRGVDRKIYNSQMRAFMVNDEYDKALCVFEEMDKAKAFHTRSSPDVYSFNMKLECLLARGSFDNVLEDYSAILQDMIERQIVPNIQTLSIYVKLTCLATSDAPVEKAVSALVMINKQFPAMLATLTLYFTLFESLLQKAGAFKDFDSKQTQTPNAQQKLIDSRVVDSLRLFLDSPNLPVVKHESLTVHQLKIFALLLGCCIRSNCPNEAKRLVVWLFAGIPTAGTSTLQAILPLKCFGSEPELAVLFLQKLAPLDSSTSFQDWLGGAESITELLRHNFDANNFLEICIAAAASQETCWSVPSVSEQVYRFLDTLPQCKPTLNTIGIVAASGGAIKSRFARRLLQDIDTVRIPAPKKGRAIKDKQRYKEYIRRKLERLATTFP